LEPQKEEDHSKHEVAVAVDVHRTRFS
jgi:hypothetical protein